jgi:hypothetical protein
MFTPKQYRAKAIEYGESLKTSTDPNQSRELRARQHRFTELADNQRWLSDNHQRTLSASAKNRSDDLTIAEEEEHMLRCLGAALIMQWNTLPAELRRELFDNAGAMGELSDIAAATSSCLISMVCRKARAMLCNDQGPRHHVAGPEPASLRIAEN